MNNSDNLKEAKYVVWSSIEYTNEDAGVFYDIDGSMRSIKKFKTLEEAKEYQSRLISEQNYKY